MEGLAELSKNGVGFGRRVLAVDSPFQVTREIYAEVLFRFDFFNIEINDFPQTIMDFSQFFSAEFKKKIFYIFNQITVFIKLKTNFQLILDDLF
ncbi:hypothetical protein BpHYR1_044212 [Brachionus plicatilis]|uniref:Uncharacterized protein n=1 Tax=Brachionus plicatilis TaxID=10195 RepID=A0A3M7PT60_BRAPC|nr:hypothetical protein BpHYR1_044212 [Brachionus plicatilis]